MHEKNRKSGRKPNARDRKGILGSGVLTELRLLGSAIQEVAKGTAASNGNERDRVLHRDKIQMRAFQSGLVRPLMEQLANPRPILEAGLAYWPSRVICVAVEFGVFTFLAKGPQPAERLMSEFGWHPRASRDFLDGLVALGLLQRDDETELYSTSREADLFLDREKPSYLGGLLVMSSRRLYELWLGLPELLRTGKMQAPEGAETFFEELAGDPDKYREFMEGMTGMATPEAMIIAAHFPWKAYKTFVDVGAAQGALPVRIVVTHPHMTGASFDLIASKPLFEEYVASFGLSDKLRFVEGDIRTDALPKADVVSFGHVFHGFDIPSRKKMLKKAWDALPPGGGLIVYDGMIDAERRRNVMGFMSSLNIMMETEGGFEATTAQCVEWFGEAGFVDMSIVPLTGPASMVYGFKPKSSRH